jgi:hypothetical protein
MVTLQEERQHLAKADQLIANGDRCRAAQKIRIAEMKRRGEDTRIAQEMLQAQKEALTQMRWHRRLIRDEIARLSPGSNVGAFRSGTGPQNAGHPRPDRRR